MRARIPGLARRPLSRLSEKFAVWGGRGWDAWLSDPAVRRYVSWLAPDRRQVLGVIGLGLFSGVLLMLVPYFSKVLLDHSLSDSDAMLTLWIGLGAVGSLGLGHGADWLRTRWEARLIGGSIRRIRLALYEGHWEPRAIVEPPLAVGSASLRLGHDAEQVGQFVCVGVINPLLHCTRVLGALVVICWLNWVLALFISLLAIPLIAWSRIWFLRTGPLFDQIGRQKASIEGRVTEVLRGLKSLISSNGKQHFVAEFAADQDLLLRRETEAKDLNAFLSFVWAFALPFAQLMCLILGVALISWGGEMSVAEIVAVQLYLALLLNPIWQLVDAGVQIQRHLVSIRRVFGDEFVVSDDGVPTRGQLAMEPLRRLRLERVAFGFGDSMVLKHLDWSISAGSFTVLVGPSGAGKTTLLDLLAGFRVPSRGQVQWNCHSLAEVSPTVYRSRVCLVPQESVLFAGSIWENIVLGRPDMDRNRLIDLAEAMGLADCLPWRDQGWDRSLRETGGGLSGGQRQAVGLLRALAMDPEVLLLDESTSYLDLATERRVLAFLASHRSGHTTLLVTHRSTFVDYADDVAVLVGGELAGVGAGESLLERCPWYRSNFLAAYSVAARFVGTRPEPLGELSV